MVVLSVSNYSSSFSCAVFIPARLESTRLPRKVLADIHGLPMVVRALHCALKADIGPVFVACDSSDVCDIIYKNNGNPILTSDYHISGTDRIYEAYCSLKGEKCVNFTHIINLQADMPYLPSSYIQKLAHQLRDDKKWTHNVSTLVSPITKQKARETQVVKVALSPMPSVASSAVPSARLTQEYIKQDTTETIYALYFTRAMVPWAPLNSNDNNNSDNEDGDALPFFGHIGIYGYSIDSLVSFSRWLPGTLEKRERLEQLRFLEHGYSINVELVDHFPCGVDTPKDLAYVRNTF